jgi:DNA modification methylase
MEFTKARRSARSKPNLVNNDKGAKPKRTRNKARQSQGSCNPVYDGYRATLTEAGVTLIQGDSRVKMSEMEENSIHALITDPPYGLTDGSLDIEELLREWMTGGEYKSARSGFMRKAWDSTVPSPALWREAWRVLKPGGYCLAFAGTRTQDLTSLALRMAGFEIRDTVIWHYGQGMPKSRNIGCQLGHGSRTAVGSGLKPAHEPIIIARKPLEPGLSLAENARKWGTGGLNIDATRIGETQTSAGGPPGRWPTNALFSHTEECRLRGREEVASGAHAPGQKVSGFGRFGGGKVIADGESFSTGREAVQRWACAPGCPVRELEEQQGNTPSRYFQTFPTEVLGTGEPGFMYTPKPTKAEREAGLRNGKFQARRGERLAYGKRDEVATIRLNPHPTVKRIDVMRWLIRLACPEGGTVLDPFAGSGTTGCAAVREGRRFIGIELDEEEGYIDVAAARIMHSVREVENERDAAGEVACVIPFPSTHRAAQQSAA